jgi:hypothetical protein
MRARAVFNKKPKELTDTPKPCPCPIVIFGNELTSPSCSKCGYPITVIARYDVEYTADSIRELLIEHLITQTAFLELMNQRKK